jgi:hypothetical protein
VVSIDLPVGVKKGLVSAGLLVCWCMKAGCMCAGGVCWSARRLYRSTHSRGGRLWPWDMGPVIVVAKPM